MAVLDSFHSSRPALLQLLPAKDCYDLLQKGYTDSGVYAIYLVEERKLVTVYCDMETDGGGWLVRTRIQHIGLIYFGFQTTCSSSAKCHFHNCIIP